MKKTHLSFAPKMNGRNSKTMFSAYRSDGNETPEQKKAREAKEDADFLETIKGLDEAGQATVKAARAQFKAVQAEMEANMISKEDAEQITKTAVDAASTELKAIIEDLKKKTMNLGVTVSNIKNNAPTEEKPMTFRKQLEKAFDSVKDEIETILKNRGKQSGPLIAKVATTITAEGTIGAGGSAAHYNLTQSTGIISTIRKRVLTYLQNVGITPIDPTRPYVNWIEELDEQGTPIMIGEGDGKTMLSVRYEEREKKAKKIAVYGKVTTEMMRYLPRLIAYIENNLMKRVDIITEDQLFNGDDTGDNLKGIIPYATAFDGGIGTKAGAGLVGLVPAPTYADVIRAAVLQVQNSYGVPNAFYVDNDILALMDTEKDDLGGYVLPPFKSTDGTTVAGVRLIPTTALAGTTYEFVGGDLSVVGVGFTDNMSIQIGLDGNDFTNNKKTIIVEQELVQWVSANDTAVLIKGTFQTAKDLISAPVVP